ncbi:TPA: restriction endonuclease subunit S [Vibrio vulnificus]
MVPNGWMTATLGDLVNKSAFGPRFTSELYAENGAIGTIRTTDLYNEGEINYATIPYANLNISEYEEHILKEGDLLITRSGTCGIPCIFTEQEKPIIAGAFLIRFQLNNKIESKFLHEVLKSAPIQSDIKRMAAGGVQKNLTGTSLKKLSMLIPPLPEQRKIAQILSTWDRGIATTEKLIDASKQQKKALMQQLLTGKKRLLDPETGKAFQGEWYETTMASLFSISAGKSKSKFISDTGQYLIVDMGSISREGKLIASKKTSHDSDFLSLGQLVMPKDDIGGGQIIGRTAYIPESGKFILSDHVYLLEPKTVNSLFASYLINSWEINKQLRSKANGTAQLGLGKKDVEKQKLVVPKSLQEQQKIASVLTAADKEIELLEAKLAHFKQEKKALMQQLLTGKRRVRVAETEAA